MARLRRLRSLSATLGKVLVGVVVVVLVLIGLVLALLETGWAKNQIRSLIVRQANQYLTATLTIGRLEGSLLRGLQLGDVRLSREGRTLIAVDEIAVAYSIRELTQPGVVIRRVRLTRPRIVGAKQADGRWDLGALVKRESRQQERTGPGRPIEVQAIEIVDGDVHLQDPLEFGASHVPTHFAALNASLAFVYYPVHWQLRFDRIAWIGSDPDLTVTQITGVFGRGSNGWFFDRFSVRTPQSAFVLDGTIDTEQHPTVLDLRVRADRFAFQEWSGILRGLKNIAVDASFDTSLKGPTTQLATDLRFAGTGGAITGHFTLDTSVPGWHGAGTVNVERLNLARWMNRVDRPSDITGRVTFDLALELGRHFPRGMYTFDGPHAMYLDYAGDDVHARGQITQTEVRIERATSVAYGANVMTVDSTIGLDDPFPFRFQGATRRVDLRRLPKPVPVPHVESLLAFDYDVSGQFANPFIAGHATFAPSEFLGAGIGAGTVGSIDTQRKPLRFAGEGVLSHVVLRRWGEGLDVGWMRDPRYAGVIDGRFHVDGSGTDRKTLRLTGGGRLARAEMFHGALTDADVSVAIENGTLRASYDGALSQIDPAVAFDDRRLNASLTGSGRVTATVRELLTSTQTTLSDYDIGGSLALRGSDVRGLVVDRAEVDASLSDSTLALARLDAAGPAIEGRVSGTVGFGDNIVTDLQYDITRADLAVLRDFTRQRASGIASASGRATGPTTALHLAGTAMIRELNAFDVTALTLDGRYDTTIGSNEHAQTAAHVDVNGSFLTVFGQPVEQTSGTVTVDGDRIGFDLQVIQAAGRSGTLTGGITLHADARALDVNALSIAVGRSPWRLQPTGAAPTVRWTDTSVTVSPLQLTGGNGDERFGVSGTWRSDGGGDLRVTASHVFLETLQGAVDRPPRYGGVLDLDAAISGTRELPIVTGTVSITSGRVERITYEKLAGRVQYSGRMFTIDMRLDQGPDVWLTAKGTLPLALFKRDLPETPIDVAIKSSAIGLGLLGGVTDVVREVSGTLALDVNAVGTSVDPHFTGTVQIANAAFLVTSTGSRYRSVRLSAALARDRVTVEALHVEDTGGNPLDLVGSLGTHELKVGGVSIDATARRFEVMHNPLGKVSVDATLHIRGLFENPRIAGDVTVTNSDLNVDEILERTLLQPYATEPTAIGEVDAVAALNPWQRLGLDIALHVPDTLRLLGSNVQVSSGTPIGLGDIRLRVAGDLYLYKDPGQPLYVTGSFDSVSGTYAFQGRRFDVLPTSSINFRGDLNPEIYVTVTRVISGIETRVSITGPMREPALQLTSTPPLDQADILSLIIFNTSTNQLTVAQQQGLMVRAGTLAAGFLASPLVSAVQSELGLEILEVETTNEYGGPRVTVGNEIAPGLIARFSRQFGSEPYDEATIEYYLSKILRLRATYSDAQALAARSPFRIVERAGIDLLFFFSF